MKVGWASSGLEIGIGKGARPHNLFEEVRVRTFSPSHPAYLLYLPSLFSAIKAEVPQLLCAFCCFDSGSCNVAWNDLESLGSKDSSQLPQFAGL